MKLDIGKSITIKLCARDFKGGNIILDVAPDEVYSFSVLPDQIWTDWFRKVGAEGFKKSFLFPQPRLAGTNYFCLCGCIENGEKEILFEIGNELKSYKVQIAGNLFYFANDYKSAYWNNKGSIEFEITRNS